MLLCSGGSCAFGLVPLGDNIHDVELLCLLEFGFIITNNWVRIMSRALSQAAKAALETLMPRFASGTLNRSAYAASGIGQKRCMSEVPTAKDEVCSCDAHILCAPESCPDMPPPLADPPAGSACNAVICESKLYPQHRTSNAG